MHRHPAVEARLALVASFVEADRSTTSPGAAAPSTTDAERAAAAVELGLHRGDLVARRIMVDSARRLIRSVALLQEPPADRVEAYLAAHRRQLEEPGRVRLSLVSINAFRWDDSAARAREVAARIETEGLGLDEALALSDPGLVEPHLPALTEQALATRMGADFARRAVALPEGGWSEPVESRHGHHLVWVHERSGSALPPWEQIAPMVEDRVRQEMADEWLARRLLELRNEFEIIVPGAPGRPS
jgi:hypothetical protein